MALEEDV